MNVTCWAGPHAEERLGGEHERPQVEALLPRRVGHPALVDLDQRVDRRDEVLDRAARAARAGALERAIRSAFSSGRNVQTEPSAWR